MLDLLAPSPDVARALLGATLTARSPEGVVTLVLTETEAYAGSADPASHAYRGPTRRNEVMFGPAGVLYVYRSHGLHWCANITTGPDGVAAAVLLRAGRVVEGVELARARRGEAVPDHRLARGPGNLGQTLGLTGADDGTTLAGPRLVLAPRAGDEPPVATGPRVGISVAADVPWRFWVVGEKTVTPYRRSPRAPAPAAARP